MSYFLHDFHTQKVVQIVNYLSTVLMFVVVGMTQDNLATKGLGIKDIFVDYQEVLPNLY